MSDETPTTNQAEMSPLENKPKTGKKKTASFGVLFFCLLILFAIVLVLFCTYKNNEIKLRSLIGPPDNSLGLFERMQITNRMARNIAAYAAPSNALHGETMPVEIVPGDTIAQAAEKLVQLGLIQDRQPFIDYIRYKGGTSSLQIGRFPLRFSMTIAEMGDALTSASGRAITFGILPGSRLEEIAAMIPASGLSFSAEEFLAAARNYPPERSPGGAPSLEGYMLPGTYEMDRKISLDGFLNGFALHFNQSVTPEMRAAFAANGISLNQGVILASMVAREALSAAEYGKIASVFYNRLARGMPFQSDPTAQYAIGWDDGSQSWWKTPLTLNDLSIASPYNTFLNQGFPPAPICSPSIDAIRAVAFPEISDFLFFRAKCDGSPFHSFSETYAEHQAYACP